MPTTLDTLFSALADPTRRAILIRLAKGDATVLELAEPFKISQPAVSRHLKVLSDAGLIVRRAEGNTRPCSLSPAALSQVDQWLALLREVLTADYHRLDQVLVDLEKSDPKPNRSKKK